MIVAMRKSHKHQWTNWIEEDYLKFECRICKICQKKETRVKK
jgi:hypothetical protein